MAVMERKEIKWAVTLLLGVILGILTFGICNQDLYIKGLSLEGEQIAKRVENTKYGDKFYILVDTKYGLIEKELPYNQWVNSSNNEYKKFRIKYAEARGQLENPRAVQKDYPYTGYAIAILILFVLGCIFEIGLLIQSMMGRGNDYQYLGIVLLAILFGFVLYLIA